jgi:hypothetical protein
MGRPLSKAATALRMLAEALEELEAEGSGVDVTAKKKTVRKAAPPICELDVAREAAWVRSMGGRHDD